MNNDNVSIQDWMILCGNGINVMANAIKLTDVLNNNQVAIDKAVNGQLAKNDYRKVVNYIVRNMDQTDNPEQDAVMFEIAWELFNMSNHADSDDVTDNEVQFTTDVRRAYYMKRFR